MLPKNHKQLKYFISLQNPHMILVENSWVPLTSNANALGLTLPWSLLTVIPEHLNQDPIALTKTTLTCHHPLCKFYNLPILGTQWIHSNGMTRHRLDYSNVDLSTQRYTAHRLYSYGLTAFRIGSSLTWWYLDSSHHHCKDDREYNNAVAAYSWWDHILGPG